MHEPHMECRRHNGLWCTGSRVMERSIEALGLGKMEEVNEATGGEWGNLVQKSGYGSIKKPLLTRRKGLQILGIQEGGLQQVLKAKDMG